MKNNTDPRKSLAELIILSAKLCLLKKAVFSKPKDRTIIRAVATPHLIGNKPIVQAEYFRTDNKAVHENIDITADNAVDCFSSLAEKFCQVNLITTVGECEYKMSSSGKEIIIGGDKLLKKLESPETNNIPKNILVGNNRVKQYILSGNEEFLIKLGVSDKNGRPHDKKRSKLRQINRFLEYVRDIESHLPNSGTIYICDLCCGKSYLSFAVYYYFSKIKSRNTEMYCVDLKPDVMDYCRTVASELAFDGMHFICGDVATYEPPHKPDLVVSLHACDTATDLVLNKASAWRTKAILSTPCCHHEMNHNLNCETLSFITEHSMLRQKFCDAATDSLRLKKLQAEGYTTEAVELVDPDDTPKNILLRAVLKNKPDEKALAEYNAAKAFLYGNK